MANVVAIDIEVDAGKSIQEVEKLESVLKSVKTETTQGNVSEQFEKLNQAVNSGGKSVESLKQAVKSYQTIALTAGRTSPIGVEALKKAAALQDELGDLSAEVKRLAHDGKNLQGALQISSGVASGFQAFTGVTALLGDENEELIKTMVKLQGIQQTVMGIEQIRTTLEKESSAMILIRNARQKVQNGLLLAYNVIVGGGTKALKLFRLALVATGLGALVVLLGVLIAKWDDWKDSILGIIKSAFSPFIKILQYIGIMESENDKIRRIATENQLNNLERLRKKQEENIRSTEEKFNHEIALLRASGKETFFVEREKLKAVNARIIEELKSLLSIHKIKGTLSKEELDRSKELLKTIKDNKKQLEILEVSHNKKVSDEGVKAYEARKQAKAKAYEEDKKAREEEAQKQIDLERLTQDYLVKNIEDANLRKLAELALQQKREREDIIYKYGKDTELIKQLELNQANELKLLKDEISLQEKKDFEEKSKEDLEKKSEFLTKQYLEESEKLIGNREKQIQIDKNFLERKYDLGLISKTDYLNSLKALNQEELDLEKKTTDGIIKAREDVLNATESLTQNLAKLYVGSEKVSKAFALTQIGIDTARAISSLVAMSQANPANAVTGGVAGALQFASGIAQIGANIRQAYALLKSSSPVTAPSSPSSNRSNSQRNDEGNGTTTQNSGNTNYTKVIVTETDIRGAMERVERINVLGTIG